MKTTYGQELSPLIALQQKLNCPKVPWDPIPLPPAVNTFEVSPGTLREIIRKTEGLFISKGKPHFLYISNGTLGDLPKFHLMNCSTVKSMDTMGHLKRYAFTNRATGLFKMHISSARFSQTGIEKDVRLDVCKNCLSEWGNNGYKGYRTSWTEEQKNRAVVTFDIPEFLQLLQGEKGRTLFPDSYYVDILTDVALPDIYPENWKEISDAYRAAKNWRCEKCRVDLHDHPELLHVHHRNGVKQDTASSNLKALCVLCHSEEPHHQHMIVSEDVRQFILQRRKEKR